MTNLKLIWLLITVVNLLWSVVNIMGSKREFKRANKTVANPKPSGNYIYPDDAAYNIRGFDKINYWRKLKGRPNKFFNCGITNEPDVDYIIWNRRKINDMEFINTIGKIIEKNISNPHYSAMQLCSDTNRERSGVFRKIKRITGMTLSEYIDFKRIELATKEIESNPDLNDDNLAQEYGFKSVSAFQEKFREFRLVGTREFRNEIKKQLAQ